ncbi:MAG: GNAT family N-acetyltransferase, partial [Devosia sp.]
VFGELGQWLETETLYRAEFGSWDEANTTQRNKSRRKHDRQQGERLEALGKVEFETIGNGPKALEVIDVMFRQRAARFVEMGVSNPFAFKPIRRFYDETAWAGSKVPVKLHVLRLNGEIVAVRYNIVAGERLFCLISSMSDDPAIQGGSPGKQCLLRVMQTEFDAGFRMFDMGAGFTDEKRHWCNVQVPVRQHYLPITRRGALAAATHRNWAVLRLRIKSDDRLLKWAKGLRAWMLKMTGKATKVEAAD